MKTLVLPYWFYGKHSVPAVASADGGVWCTKTTAAAGSPTLAPLTGGGFALAMDNTSEVQNLCLYLGDVLPFDIDDLIRVACFAKIPAALTAAVKAHWGVAAARNDDPDAIAAAALFGINGASGGSGAVHVETDDGTNDTTVATGIDLSTSWRKFEIDFKTGIQTIGPPGASVGGKANVLFNQEDSNGAAKRVARNTLFDMSNYTSGLQLFAQIQKTSGTEVGTLHILGFEVEVRVPQ